MDNKSRESFLPRLLGDVLLLLSESPARSVCLREHDALLFVKFVLRTRSCEMLMCLLKFFLRCLGAAAFICSKPTSLFWSECERRPGQ